MDDYFAPPENGLYNPLNHMPVDTNLPVESTSAISRYLYKVLGVKIGKYKNSYGKEYIGTTTPKAFAEAQLILDSMQLNGLPMNEEGLKQFLMNRSNLNRYFNKEEQEIIEKVATTLNIDKASSAFDKMFIPSAEELARFLGIGEGSSIFSEGHKYLHEMTIKLENAEGELLKEETFTDVVYPSVPRAPVKSFMTYDWKKSQ